MPTNILILVRIMICVFPAEETYTIKNKTPDKGEFVKVERKAESSDSMVVTVDGKERKNKAEKNRTEEIYYERVLENPDDPDISESMERKYELATFSKDGKTDSRNYVDQIVFIEKKNDKYRFSLGKGKELKGEDARDLEFEFNVVRSNLATVLAVLPSNLNKPIRVGTTWEIDAASFFELFLKDAVLDKKASKGSGKLMEVYKKNGRTFGKIDIELEARIVKFDTHKELKGKERGTIRLTDHFDGCIDGTSANQSRKIDVEIDIESTSVAGGKEVKAVSKITNKSVRKVTEILKK